MIQGDTVVSAELQQARASFLRGLSQLLADPRYHGWWAAYQGDQCLGISKSPQKLLREIQRRGLAMHSYYLGVIRPHEPEPEEIEPRHGQHFGNGELTS